MTTRRLTHTALHRIVRAMVAAEVGRGRGSGGVPLPAGVWPEEVRISEAGLGLDSLERMSALAALAEAFGLDPRAFGDAAPERVGDWIDLVAGASADGPNQITVMTSGSTGTPQPCSHAITDLIDEAAWIAGQVAGRRRIVALVPAHHIYGLIWTVLLPDVLGAPVIDATIGSALELAPGDLIVAVPQQWQALLRLHGRFSVDVTGVSAGGPLGDELGRQLLDVGLTRLLDVYGASETGGIAMREVPSLSYRLMPRWRLTEVASEVALLDAAGRVVPMPDHLERLGTDLIRLRGRRDGAVQVAGMNVWPAHVGKMLSQCDGVSEVAVRLGANGRLKAFLVPNGEVDAASLVEQMDRFSAACLSAVERPVSYQIGSSLPRNAMGKLTDWP